MKKHFFIYLFIILSAACSDEEKEEAQYLLLPLKDEIPLIEGDKDSIRYRIEFNIPQLTSYPDSNIIEIVNFEINRLYFEPEGIFITNNPQQNFFNLMEPLSRYYRKEGIAFKKKFPAAAASLNYELMKGGSFVYNKNKLLSLSFETYDYAGGAHGVNTIQYYHFDMNTGRIFGLSDLFEEEGQKKLLELVSAKCEIMKKDKNSEVFEESEIESCNNFYFDDENFYFVYNPYEIGPYSAGYISISLPIKEIRPLLRKDIHPGFLKK